MIPILSTGSYLAIGCDTELAIKVVKDWSDCILAEGTKKAHSKAITALAWGPRASFLASTAADRAIKIYS